MVECEGVATIPNCISRLIITSRPEEMFEILTLMKSYVVVWSDNRFSVGRQNCTMI